ncbi:hypothetical protein PQ455_03845 [Sphingomonas naphthae]|uniref:Transferrin-binding protein B C-lobe/N-lobe beta barrel domain-containing protein n=1 Tax=Sphingomonas naphthae TaxID=1813468 RepID=A0ABY7TMB2_9SPHN|nr:hypothetical protein [Sphingomonas naphthae]WCT74372.1 hypothetical protein PQ455_03845 [Sphingomonas naphthae]
MKSPFSAPAIGLLASCLMLSACGGTSDSGDVNSILTPSTGASGTNSTLTGTLVSERFPAVANRLQVSTNTAGGIINANTQTTSYGTMAISYNSASNSYTVSDSGSSKVTVFTPADQTASTAAFRHFRVGNEDLSILANQTGNPRVNLSYVTYGVWAQVAAAGGTSNYRTLVAGVQTPYGNVPRTGTGTYVGAVDGYWVAGGTQQRLLGSVGSMTANFTSGVVNTTLSISGTTDLSDNGAGQRNILGTYSGAGTIQSGTNQFGGVLNPVNQGDTRSDASYTGNYTGAFYGPNANEAGLSFNLNSSAQDGGTLSGVLVGRGTIVADPPATTTPATTTTGR